MKRLITAFFLLLCTAAIAETIAEQLTQLDQAKSDIKSAIESKGSSVSGLPFVRYDEAIASITSGGNGSSTSFVWGLGSDWTSATASSPVSFYEDLPALASSIMDVNGTNLASYNASISRIANLQLYSTATATAGIPGSIGTYTQGPAAVATDYAFFGGVLMQNGKVCLVPHTSDYVGIYDPIANTYTQGPAAVSTDYAFRGGVLMQNGKVCLVPANSDYVGIYDPIANTYTQGPAAVAADEAFCGGVLMQNGKVCLVPYKSDYVGIYDPIANTYTQGPAAVAADGAFCGGVLMQNGKVCLVPHTSNYVGIYNNGFDPIPLDACLHPLLNKF